MDHPRSPLLSRHLGSLGLAGDPAVHPLSYPGRSPEESGLLVGERFLRLRADDGAPPGHWSLEPDGVDQALPLDDALHRWGLPGLAERQPVLAVGSNASPGRVHAKLSGRARDGVPMTYATVNGLMAGVSAHVSRPGYVPAAPVAAPGTARELVVLWLDEEQLAVVDETEPNYHRIVVPAPAMVAVPGTGPLPGCHVYAGRHGCLADRHGRPFALAGQRELLSALFADLPELARVAGTRDPGEFAARARSSPELRDQVRELWRREGRTVS